MIVKTLAFAILLVIPASAATPYGYGRNDYSPIGNGTTVFRAVAAPVLTDPDRSILSGVSFIAAGSSHSVFVKSDGTAWATGGSPSVSIGIGSSPRLALAKQILQAPGGAPFTDVMKADCGGGSTLLLKTDGTVWTTGSAGTNPAPVLVSTGGPPIGSVVAVAAGDNHNIILQSDGSVWSYGNNSYGQLGDGTTTARSFPVRILESPGGLPVTGVSAIAAAERHTVLLKSDGTVWTMGYNSTGQLGDGTTLNRSSPVQVLVSPSGPPFTGVSAVSAGNSHTLLLKSNGSVWATGSDEVGNLGDGGMTNRSNPVQILSSPGGSPFTAASIIDAGSSHSLLVRDDGTVWAWGSNRYEQLGDGSLVNRNTPVPVQAANGGALDGVVGAAGGWFHSLFLKSDGTVLAVGSNSNGQLGDDATYHATSPVAMLAKPGGTAFRNVVAVAPGKVHALALKADGSLWSTGSNGHGQLGNGPIMETYQHVTPTPVLTSEGGSQVTDVVAIAAGTYHSVFVKSDGSLWAFGENQGGQLGDGTVINRAYPVPVRSSSTGPQVTGVSKVAGGHLHTVFLKNDGSPWAVGGNAYGQLGNNSFSSSYYPVRIRSATSSSYPSGLPNDVVDVAAGTYHTMFLRADGSAWWVGRDVVSSSSVASLVRKAGSGASGVLAGVTAIAAGSFHGAFLLDDMSLWVRGTNLSGELGIGSSTAITYATPMLAGPGGPAVTGVVSVAASVKPEPDLFPNEAHTVFTKTDGSVWTTGGNSYGQLGDGGITRTAYPVQLAATPGGTPITGATAVEAGTYNCFFLQPEPNSYATWLVGGYPALAASHFLTTADPDHDSLPNLIEYVLGSDPTHSDHGVSPVRGIPDDEQGVFEWSFTRVAASAGDAILMVEHSADLIQWTRLEIDSLPTPAEIILGPVDAGGMQIVTLRLPRQCTGFVRLVAKLR